MSLTPNQKEEERRDFEISQSQLDLSFENGFGSMRKSMSMGDITPMCDHLDSSNIYQPQQPHELSRTKFVSMAEALYQPLPEGHSRTLSFDPSADIPIARCIWSTPQTPMLRSKSRSPPQHIISQEEKEAMELEELKKFKIKALPVPKSILDGPIHLPEVSKKKFKARPAPKHIFEKPQVPVKPTISLTKPVSPKFHYKKANTQDLLKNKPVQPQKPAVKPQRHGPVRPEPFSFERSDEERKKRKEERIRRQIEEEKKLASSFKARLLPGGVRKRMQYANIKGSSSTTSSTSENKENYKKFEAQPPVVLCKEPFKPILQPVQLVKPMIFDLTGGKRAAEREKFDNQLKEKEEEMERLRLEREKEQEIAEKKTQMELKAKLVHHAKPVPAYTAFLPKKSAAPNTVPETPKFVRRLKKK